MLYLVYIWQKYKVYIDAPTRNINLVVVAMLTFIEEVESLNCDGEWWPKKYSV